MSAKLSPTNTDLVLFHKERKKKSRVGAFLIQELFFDEVILAHLAVLSEKKNQSSSAINEFCFVLFLPPPVFVSVYYKKLLL